MNGYLRRRLNFEKKSSEKDIGSDIIHNFQLFRFLMYHQSHLDIIIAKDKIFVFEDFPFLADVELSQFSFIESFVYQLALRGFEEIYQVEVHLLTLMLLQKLLTPFVIRFFLNALERLEGVSII